MSTKKPELEDFGITPEQYALYKGHRWATEASFTVRGVPVAPVVLFGSVLVVAVVVFVVTRDLWDAVGWGLGSICPGIFLVAGVEAIGRHFKRSRLLKSPVASRIKRYEEAEAAYQAMQAEAERAQREAAGIRREAERARQEAERAKLRKLREHWMSMSGSEFEQELGTLYRHLGYRVETTPISGDQGIDLVLRKNGQTTVVQCKSHQKPVGPAVARELYGSMVASRADNAILACTGGFTRGVEQFVRGKPITLISASELATLAETIEDKRRGTEQSAHLIGQKHQGEKDGTQDSALIYPLPICPILGCGKTMVLKGGRRGRFWRCLDYPRCRGIRNI